MVQIIHFLGDSKSIRIAPKLPINVEGRLVSHQHLLGVSCIRGARQEVQADSLEVVLGGKADECGELLHFKKKVDCLGLFVVVDKLRDYLLDELENLGHVF